MFVGNWVIEVKALCSCSKAPSLSELCFSCFLSPHTLWLELCESWSHRNRKEKWWVDGPLFAASQAEVGGEKPGLQDSWAPTWWLASCEEEVAGACRLGSHVWSSWQRGNLASFFFFFFCNLVFIHFHLFKLFKLFNTVAYDMQQLHEIQNKNKTTINTFQNILKFCQMYRYIPKLLVFTDVKWCVSERYFVSITIRIYRDLWEGERGEASVTWLANCYSRGRLPWGMYSSFLVIWTLPAES